ncbi:lipase family alpha/beta hydrolase [Duganella qianjiadongensis]|uniref:GPI inositol-deacylase PGAP1-like alpha/beta domain-containing protein n=1 Tax=Duganella qianjiadongensis TaxID=2692176 RepID=A0ABW9VG99_9BURK|nr:alpha/beta hydrolase [Duganella qianjiadongensis]MYM38493.1 hypothetical protein [Duganella qianjiadongensis]
MTDFPPRQGYQLPTYPEQQSGYRTQGFATPVQDKLPQTFDIPPRRVLPIIFLPGIMGSNLRMSAERQQQMGKSNNIAWRPDNAIESAKLGMASARIRQLQLDFENTEVDEYDPANNPTGNPNETSTDRNGNVSVNFFYALNVGIDTPLLCDDPASASPRKSKDQKARERGWGEIYFDCYRTLLETCELELNTAFHYGFMNERWKQIVGVPPSVWQAHPQPPLEPLDRNTLKETVENIWFPVHAMGYNWLNTSAASARRLAQRINVLIKRYQDQGFQCEKVIVVTHSMGGLVARALIHPEMGNMKDKILGMVHGVMPAIGAGAAYKRMRCGFEDSFLSISPKVVGNNGNKVTAVLANAPGALELLPNQNYGNGWLQVTHNNQTLLSLPEYGDPYEEIYKLKDVWYGLIKNEWINPALILHAGFDRTIEMLEQTKKFHCDIAETYHELSYAHYGADPAKAAWYRVVWSLDGDTQFRDVRKLAILRDNKQGRLHVVAPPENRLTNHDCRALTAHLMPPTDSGDQTVPTHSSDHQLRSGKFKGIFRQTGYEHQDSYNNSKVLNSTLYCLIRIAQTMKWSK